MFKGIFHPQAQDSLPYSPQPPVNLKQIYERQPLAYVADNNKHNQNIVDQINALSDQFNGYRSVRGDGNCYFRAVGFAFMEHLIRATTSIQEMELVMQNFKKGKGYYRVRKGCESVRKSFNYFLEQLYDLKKQQKVQQSYKQLETMIANNTNNFDNALVWEMRSITVNYLEIHYEYFQFFTSESYESILKQVLTMGKEAESLGVGAIEVALRIKLQIIMVDRKYKESIQFQQYNIPGILPLLYILYKPGHYDLIYSKQQNIVDGFDENQGWSIQPGEIPGYSAESPAKPFYININPSENDAPFIDEPELKDQMIDLQPKFEQINKQQNMQFSQSSYREQSSFVQDLNSSQGSMVIQSAQQEQLIQCEKCKSLENENNFIKNKCKHRICNKCQFDHLQDLTNGFFLCAEYEQGFDTESSCKCYVLTADLIKILCGDELYEKCEIQLRDRKIEMAQQYLECKSLICNNFFSKEQQIILKCSHNICLQCLQEQLNKQQVQKGRNNYQPKCVVCYTPFSTDILKEINECLGKFGDSF